MSRWAWDVTAGLGLALLTGGLAWVFPPLGLIVCGCVILALGLWGAQLQARAEARRRGEE
jgi:hypothetical protein